MSCRSGKAKYENGAIYEGDFEEDKRQGWGAQCFPDESIYIGEWTNDKMEGVTGSESNTPGVSKEMALMHSTL